MDDEIDRQLAARLLRMASEVFCNFSCNDLALSDTEAAALAHAESKGADVGLTGSIAIDWMVMNHLADRLEDQQGKR